MFTQPRLFSVPVKESRAERGEEDGGGGRMKVGRKRGNLPKWQQSRAILGPAAAAEVSGAMAPHISPFISLLPSVISGAGAPSCKPVGFI